MPRGVYVRTEAYREKQRLAMMRHENPGKNKSAETRKKIGDAQRGKPKTEAFKAKCSQRMRGKPGFFRGKKHSEATKALLSGDKNVNWKGGYSRTKEWRSAYNIAHRRKKNGFPPGLFAERLAEQGGSCAICGIKLTSGLRESAASADHCHERMIPRGILCKRCNLMLGHARDNEDILSAALVYLARWRAAA